MARKKTKFVPPSDEEFEQAKTKSESVKPVEVPDEKTQIQKNCPITDG